MHLAIDLGNTYTFLTCWEKGKPHIDACIRVSIPGMTRFSYSTAKYFWDRDGMREYLGHLYLEYILPSRIMVESATILFPTILNLNTHRMLLDVAEEVFGLSDVSIIPQPIALVYGYNLHNPQLPLTGDIMVIHSHEAELNFAFISIIDTYGITLEKQFTGSLSQAQKEAALIGFYSHEGWQLDSVLLGADPPYPSVLDELLKSLPEKVNVISEQNLQFVAPLDVLSWAYQEKSPNLSCAMSFVYPFEFYIEKLIPNQDATELVKIPFDTANLELEYGANYQLLTLNSSGMYNLTNDPDRVKFNIYELDNSHGSQTTGSNLILAIDSLKSDLPERMQLYLDMATATLSLEINSDKIDRISFAELDFHSRLLSGQGKIYEMLKSNNAQHKLIADFENHLLYANPESQTHLTDQTELILFRLYALLQLWQGK